MRDLDLAYLAGAVDSDGTIGIKKSTYAMRVVKSAGQAVYSERVALRHVTPQVPALLKKYFGGSAYMTKPSTPNGRPLFSWAATDLRAVACLTALLPYLRVKKRQARVALRLRKIKDRSRAHRSRYGRGHVGGGPRPQQMSDAMEALYQQAKTLNRVGV